MISLCSICAEPSHDFIMYNLFQERSCDTCMEWLVNVLEWYRLKFIKACDGNIIVAQLLDRLPSNKELYN